MTRPTFDIQKWYFISRMTGMTLGLPLELRKANRMNRKTYKLHMNVVAKRRIEKTQEF
jgi:hypothetical protein